jgi:hypothetical protein
VSVSMSPVYTCIRVYKLICFLRAVWHDVAHTHMRLRVKYIVHTGCLL